MFAASIAFDETLVGMRKELLEVMTKRRSKILKVALDIFNKVQGQKISTFKLNDIENIADKAPGEDGVKNNIDELIQKFEILLESPRSPLISALKNLAQYKGDKGFPSFSKVFKDFENTVNNNIDLNSLTKENKMFEDITSELFNSQETLKRIQGTLQKEQFEFGKFSGYEKNMK